ncbi:hypothetical protein [Nocardia wallacei]|uniref:hypothetical protein n=1 Tax=Nocardia wallacei TaxID=480035 RepID=UPI002455CA67|nr:hypothetical protein [Nocardia wallacei]
MSATLTGIYEAKLSATRVARTLRAVVPTVLTVSGTAGELQPPGSLCIIVAPAGSAELDRIAAAVRAGRPQDADESVAAMNRVLAKQEPLALDQLNEVIDRTPAFVDVEYAGSNVATTVFPHGDFDFARVVLPYAGGTFDPEKFAVVEYGREDGDPVLDVLVVVHEPERHEVVERILSRLPAESDALRIGVAASEDACTVTATPVVVAVTVAIIATAATSCAPAWNRSEWVINPAEDLAVIAPTLGVRQLVEMRRQMFNRPSR